MYRKLYYTKRNHVKTSFHAYSQMCRLTGRRVKPILYARWYSSLNKIEAPLYTDRLMSELAYYKYFYFVFYYRIFVRYKSDLNLNPFQNLSINKPTTTKCLLPTSYLLCKSFCFYLYNFSTTIMFSKYLYDEAKHFTTGI